MPTGGSDGEGNELSSDNTQNKPSVQRSDRIASKPRCRYNLCVTKCDGEQGGPETFDEAVSSSNANLWKAAMVSGIQSLTASTTWYLTDLPQGRKSLKCKWVFKTKFNANGDMICNKARLVAKGSSHHKGVDYD